MADRRTTLLQCSLRIRRRRKWKTRWCSLTKLSPVSDQVILRFYKNQDAVELGKEIGREQISISAQNFCGISLAYRYSKNPYVLTVICLDLVVLLSFDSHDQLLNWYHKIQNTLPSATAFQTPVIVPNQPSKIHPGRALLHFYDNHFALTPEIPKELINSWSLSALQKYTFVGDSIFFSSTTSKGEKTFVLVTKDRTVAENLKNHFDLATSVLQPPRERLSYIDDSGFQQLPQNQTGVPPSSSSSSNNGGDRYNHGSQNGGPFVHKRNQDEYGLQVLHHVNGDICRANSCSEHGSFGSRRQFEALRGRTDSHDSTAEPSVFDPLLLPSSSGDQHQNCIPMQDMLSGASSVNTGVPATTANGDNDFGFWKPSHSEHDETMYLYECTGGSDPSVPVREQNYEVMNLFDHIRHKHDQGSRTIPSQHCQHTMCSKCRDHASSSPSTQMAEQRQVDQEEPEDSNEETGYMNLFTRRVGQASSPTVPLTPLYIPGDSLASDGKSPTLSHNSYFFLPAKQIVNLNRCELPIPGASTTAAVVIPVPFDHDSLVKPSGPIAMLKSPTGSASYDGGAIASEKTESPEVKVTRSGSGPPSVDEGSQMAAIYHRERQNSCPFENGRSMPRKYSMPPVSGNLLADTRQSPYGFHAELPPALPPRIPPREPFLPSPQPPYYMRQRCYTDSVYAVKGGASASLDAEHGYLMMKPAYQEKLRMMSMRSRSVASSPVDVAIPTSPLGVASRVYNTHYMGVWDRRNVSPSLIRSGSSGRVDPGFRFLKRSATVATNLTRQGRDGLLAVSTRRGSMPSPGGTRSFPQRSHSTATSHVPRPRTSRDYASIDPESIAQKQGSLSCRSSQDNILSSCEHSFTFSDTSGSGTDVTPSSSSLSDLSSQASNSRASSFGSQSGVGLLYQRGGPLQTNKDSKEVDAAAVVDDVNGNR